MMSYKNSQMFESIFNIIIIIKCHLKMCYMCAVFWVLPSDKFCDDNCVTMATQNYFGLMNVLEPLK